MDLNSEEKSNHIQKPNKESVEEIKKLLRYKLQKSGMNKVIRRMVRDICLDQNNTRTLSPDEVIEEIYRRGLINSLVKELKCDGQSEPIIGMQGRAFGDKSQRTGNDQNETEMNFFTLFSQLEAVGSKVMDGDSEYSSSETTTETNGESISTRRNQGQEMGKMGKFHLKMEILGGSAFLDHLFDEDTSSSNNNKSNFVLNVFYMNQRFSTKPTMCTCEPPLRDTFMIDIGHFESTSELLLSNEPIRIILVRNDVMTSKSCIISHCLHDWRFILAADSASRHFSLELMGIGSEYKVPMGILHIRMSLFPRPPQTVSKGSLTSQANSEDVRRNEAHRLFLVYAKQWWKDFNQIRPGLDQRLVKIFSYDENMVSKPVQTFIEPIITDSVVLTPQYAAWFVSLISVTDFKCGDINIISSQSKCCSKLSTGLSTEFEYFQSLESTIASKSGTVADHAILLCSLLLGFGLDAYVAFGTKMGNFSWFWVITFDRRGVPSIWESTKGICQTFFQSITAIEADFSKNDESVDDSLDIKTVSVLFNNRVFYANIQSSDRVDMIEWNVKIPSKWKQIPEASFKRTQKTAPTLLFGCKNAILIATDVEMDLRTLIFQARQNLNLKTIWDEKLREIMGQQIANDEIIASSGAKNLENYFESAILNYLPSGYDFKGSQFHSNAANSMKLFNKIIADPKFKEIILIRGDDVQLAVRVLCFVYPEDLISVRIMIACKFLCVD